MPIESGPCRVGVARAVGAVDPWAVRAVASETNQSNGVARSLGPVRPHEPLDAGPMPVDVERVGEIRRAIELGTYPLVPARVADAMIAAGLLLRTRK